MKLYNYLYLIKNKFILIKKQLQQIELVDALLVLAWIIQSIATLCMSINWWREGYYFLSLVNIIITLVISYASGYDMLDQFYFPNTHRIKHYIRTTKRGFFSSLRIISPKIFIQKETYFTRKSREIDDFCVTGAEVIVKGILLFVYTHFTSDIGTNNYYPFRLLLLAVTVNYFIIFYISNLAITKEIGLFMTFCATADVAAFFLLFTILDYTLFVNLILQFILVLIGHKVLSPKDKNRVLVRRSIAHSLFRFNLHLFIVFAIQKEDDLFEEGSKYKQVWEFVNCKDRGDFHLKLNIARKVIAEKLIRQCGDTILTEDAPITTYIASCAPGRKMLTKRRIDIGFLITDIKYKIERKCILKQILYSIVFSIFMVSNVLTLMYPFINFTSATLMSNYLFVLYKTCIVGICISGKMCFSFAKFAYYSRFMVKVPKTLKLDSHRMRNILHSQLRCQDLSILISQLDILLRPIITIIVEYEKEERDVLRLECSECLPPSE
jgi:hypothetical protein